MKVVLEAQHACTPNPRGIPIFTTQIIRHLLKRKKNDYSITFFDKDKERNNRSYIDHYFSEYNVPIYECNSESYKTLLAGAFNYKEKSYNLLTGADGELFHFMHVSPIPTNVSGKIVVTVHDVMPITHPEFFNDHVNNEFILHWNNLLQLDPVLVADSYATKQEIMNISGYDNIHVVELGYDEGTFYYDPDLELFSTVHIESPYVFYCGGIDMRKNIIGIMDAFEMISKDIPELKLVLAGKFYLNSVPIQKRMAEYEHDDRIIYLGYITDEMKRVLMSNASAFLFPSFYEGFGLPILEAMACGCPVITSDISSMPEVAGNAAVMIDPSQTDILAENIFRIVSSEKMQTSMRKKGFENVRKFSWDKSAEKLENVYLMSL